MAWTWGQVVALNAIICAASGQPGGVRCPINYHSSVIDWPEKIAQEHPFIEGNQRTAACLAICLTLEKV